MSEPMPQEVDVPDDGPEVSQDPDWIPEDHGDDALYRWGGTGSRFDASRLVDAW